MGTGQSGVGRPWVTATQRAFLDGYAAVSGVDPRAHSALLTAFELDKAMYEVVCGPGTGQTGSASRSRPSTGSPPVMTLPQEELRDSTPHHEVSGAIAALVQGRHQQPHDLLGQHLEEGRAADPRAQADGGSVRVRFEDGEELALGHEAEGVFSAVRPDADRTMDYRVLTTWGDGIEHE